MIEDRGEAPAISVMEYKRLLEVLYRQEDEMDALILSLRRHEVVDMKKMRLAASELDETIWRMELDNGPAGKQSRAELGELIWALDQFCT